MTDRKSNRREFLQTAAVVGLGLAGSPASAPASEGKQPYRPPEGFAAAAMETVRIGFVGVGLQGGSHVQNFLGIAGVEIVAVCDIDDPRAQEVAGWIEADGRPRPALYTQGDTDYKRLCERDDVDLIFNSTPWRWHVPVCIEAMETGKHTAVEVPAAYRIEDCWRLVEMADSLSAASLNRT